MDMSAISGMPMTRKRKAIEMAESSQAAVKRLRRSSRHRGNDEDDGETIICRN